MSSTMGAMRLVERKTRVRLITACFIVMNVFMTVRVTFSQASMTNSSNRSAPGESAVGREYSGMYAFLEEGEFVQITVEDDGKVSGFVSRYGAGGSEKGEFLDHYFRSGKLEGNKLTFSTAVVQGKSFDFKGTVERGEGKNPGDEAYYILKGTLTGNSTDAAKKISSQPREVALKKFPEEGTPPKN